MAEFSWSDSVKAVFSPCLSCLSLTSRTHRNDRPSENSSRPDLDRLLQDVDTDTEVETLSLHSNIGDSRRKRRKKRGPPKTITLFGYNLFGKPPIRLEGGDDLTAAIISPAGGRGSSSTVKKSISTSTLDSDAAPLDPSTIAQLSAAQSSSPGPSAEESQRKEERRRKRRERKEKKEALVGTMGQADAEFEGFPGSGPGVPTPLSPREFVIVSPISPNEALAEDADFDAEAYNTKRHTGSTRSGSDSRSKTSASTSNLDPPHYSHHYSQQPAPIPAPTIRRQDLHDVPQKKRKSSRPKGSSKSSSSKTSQSPSIRSPVESTFPSHPVIVKPDFEGFPDDGSFPSTGFGGGRMSRKNSEMGVFLARRGDD